MKLRDLEQLEEVSGCAAQTGRGAAHTEPACSVNL